MNTKKKVSILVTITVCIIAILLCILLPLFLKPKDNNYLYNIFMDSKEAFNKIDKWDNIIISEENGASKSNANLLKNSAEKKSTTLVKSDGYFNYGLVSYYSEGALHKFLYEEDNSISKVIKRGLEEIQNYQNHKNDSTDEYDSPEYTYPKWMDDIEKIKGIMTLDITMENGIIERTVIATEFSQNPYKTPFNGNKEDPPTVLGLFAQENLLNYYGIHYVKIEKDSENEFVYYTNVLPIKLIIENGLVAREEGYYSEDMKIFYKLNTLNPIVTIADGTEQIVDLAFYLPTLRSSVTVNTSLREVILPNSVKYIGKGAFGECMALERVNRPKSLEYLDEEWDYAYQRNSYEMVKRNFPDEQVASPDNLHLFDFVID